MANVLEELVWLNKTELSVGYAAAELTVGVPVLIGNMIVLLSFIRVGSLRTHRNIFIISLALADLMLGILTVPFCIIIAMGLPRHLFGCRLSLALADTPVYVSMFAFLAITLDRLWAIAWPFSYQKRMRKTIALRICCGAWFLGTILAFLPVLGWYNHNGWNENNPGCFSMEVQAMLALVFSHGVIAIVCLIVLIPVYIYLYVQMIKQMKTIEKLTIEDRRVSTTSDKGVTCGITYIKLMSDTKHAIIVGKIVFVFLICQLPLPTIFWIRTFSDDKALKFIPSVWSSYALILLHANSALNPFLYAYHLSEIREAMKGTVLALVRCKC